MIERHIDYLQFSSLFSETRCISEKFQTIPPTKFYNRGYKDAIGYRYYFGNPKSKKCMIQASGEALQNERDRGIYDYEILNLALKQGKITRLDLAVTEWNTFTGMITLEEVEQWVRNGIISSPLLGGSCKLISRIFEGKNHQRETLYIGDIEKRGKKGIFRAYDKGIELNIGEYMATRLELELRGDKANNNAKRIAESGDIAGNFRASFDVNHRDFDRLMDADAVIPRRGQAEAKKEEIEADNDKWIWLMKQVAPALRKAIKKDLDNGLGTVRAYYFLKASGIDAKMFLEAPKKKR